jgi:CRP/FNR family transcriptional regulator, anaerobic regulatory protein
MKAKVKENYGYLFEANLIAEIVDFGFLKEVKEGSELIDFGDELTHMPLLLEGAIKIIRQDEDGDELVLYYIEKGDTCAMTMTCCMGNTKSEIRATAEMDSSMVMIPVQKMSDWLQDYTSWKAFVFESYNNRFVEMLEAIDNLAFMNMHERTFKYLRDKIMVGGDPIISATHQEIANDMHSSRVVISRILKSFEKEGKIKMHRNKIEVLDY